MKKFYLKLVLLILFTSSTSFAQTYVTPTGAGTKDGSSWSNAFDGTQLQQAINGSVSGSQVWVAKGTYKPTEDLSTSHLLTDGITPTTDRDKTFILKPGVEIYGGFAGGEAFGVPALTARDFAANETILSGDLNNNNTADDGDHYHVISSRNNSLNAVLDGFTIQHGFANGTESITEGGEAILQSNGGGVNLRGDQTNASFSNLNVQNNGSNAFSGGIYASLGGGYDFTNVKFESNIGGGSGGALYINTTAGSTVNVTSCTFNNNKGAGDGGGAIYNSATSTSTINVNNCTFSNNETTLYGGAIRFSNGTANVINTTFSNGKTTEPLSRGGAIYSTSSASVKLDGCVFNNNSSVTGGHYYLFSGDANIKNTIFQNGIASGSGGAIYVNSSVTLVDILSGKFYSNQGSGGGAIYSNTNLNISKSEFRSNSATDRGGALYTITSSLGTEVNLSNSLFYDNVADGTGSGASGGGAIYHTRNSPGSNKLIAINNTFFGNKSPNSTHGAVSFNGAATVILNLYNNVFNGNTGDGTGSGDIRRSGAATQSYVNNLFQENITSDNNLTVSNAFLLNATTPEALFASINASDFNFLYPTSDSFAIDKGSNALYASVGDINTDTHLAGYARLSGPVIDLGAVEYSITLPVTISSFTAKLANSRTQLRWTVGTEDNVNRYEIERSQNGTDFVKVAETKATLANSYNVTDANPQIGLNYYRLKTVDNDGKFSHYASLQTVNVSALIIASAKVYPNPVIGGLINVSLSGYPVGTYQAKLVSTAGVTVQQNIVNYDGTKDISFTSNAPAGLYILHLVNGDVKVQTKLIKQ